MSGTFKVAENYDELTATQLIDQLKSVNILTTATKKDKVWKIYQENLEKLKALQKQQTDRQACLIKAFGDHGTSRLCAKCKAKQQEIYTSCSTAKTVQAEKKTEKKSTRKSNGAGLWGVRKNSLTHIYCQFLFNAGDKGIEMADAKYADWNRKCQTFYEVTKKLIDKGYVAQDDKKFFVTQKGIENSPLPT